MPKYIYKHTLPLLLESGEKLPRFQLVYHTFGQLNKHKTNVIWVVHAFSANSDPTEWWPGVVGDGCVINPDEHFIVCVNSLGSHYGSTGPLSMNPVTKKPYYHDFPFCSNRDVVNAFIHLRKHLKINDIKLMVGPSLGGQQCLEWSIIEPDIIKNVCLIGTNAYHSPWGIAFNESQRMAIENDPSWKLYDEKAGLEGMKVARSIALLSYRTPAGYNRSQHDPEEKLEGYRASSYQRYQGEKIARRFNAFSYHLLSKMMDAHNVGRNRGGVQKALKIVKANCTVVGLESDILFPLEDQEFLTLHLPNAKLVKMDSILGHDGFLTEAEQVSSIISEIIN